MFRYIPVIGFEYKFGAGLNLDIKNNPNINFVLFF